MPVRTSTTRSLDRPHYLVVSFTGESRGWIHKVNPKEREGDDFSSHLPLGHEGVRLQVLPPIHFTYYLLLNLRSEYEFLPTQVRSINPWSIVPILIFVYYEEHHESSNKANTPIGGISWLCLGIKTPIFHWCHRFRVRESASIDTK